MCKDELKYRWIYCSIGHATHINYQYSTNSCSKTKKCAISVKLVRFSVCWENYSMKFFKVTYQARLGWHEIDISRYTIQKLGHYMLHIENNLLSLIYLDFSYEIKGKKTLIYKFIRTRPALCRPSSNFFS